MQEVLQQIRKFDNSAGTRETSFFEQTLAHDYCDSAVSYYLFLFFLAITIVVNVSTFVGTPLECTAMPSQAERWNTYAQVQCLLKGTYYWPDDLPLDTGNDENPLYPKRRIHYYALIPLILITSSAFLVMPNIYWQFYVNMRSPFGIIGILKILRRNESYIYDQVVRTVCKSIACNFHYYKYIQHRCNKYCKHGSSFTYSHNPRFLLRGYMIFKLLICLSLLSAFFTIHLALDHRFIGLGPDFLSRIFKKPYQQSLLFPLFTLCDAEFNFVQHKYMTRTYECVMTRNIFHDAAFTTIWFLLVGGFATSIVNFAVSCHRFYSTNSIYNQVERYLMLFLKKIDEGVDRKSECTKCKNNPNPCDVCKRYIKFYTYTDRQAISFIDARLSPDILLCLWFIEHKTFNSSELIKAIVSNMWLRRDSAFKETPFLKPSNKGMVLMADPIESCSSEGQSDSNEHID